MRSELTDFTKGLRTFRINGVLIDLLQCNKILVETGTVIKVDTRALFAVLNYFHCEVRPLCMAKRRHTCQASMSQAKTVFLLAFPDSRRYLNRLDQHIYRELLEACLLLEV